MESGHSICHRAQVLLSPKKYGKDWTRFLGLSFSAGSFGFAVFALLTPFMDYPELSDKVFAALGFFVAAVVLGALGKDQLKKAAEMTGDRHGR